MPVSTINLRAKLSRLLSEICLGVWPISSSKSRRSGNLERAKLCKNLSWLGKNSIGVNGAHAQGIDSPFSDVIVSSEKSEKFLYYGSKALEMLNRPLMVTAKIRRVLT